jgi:hypothetical protein
VWMICLVMVSAVMDGIVLDGGGWVSGDVGAGVVEDDLNVEIGDVLGLESLEDLGFEAVEALVDLAFEEAFLDFSDSESLGVWSLGCALGAATASACVFVDERVTRFVGAARSVSSTGLRRLVGMLSLR